MEDEVQAEMVRFLPSVGQNHLIIN